MVSIAEILSEKQKLRQLEREYKRKPKREAQEYLNRHDREEFMVLAAVASKLEDFIQEWYKYGRPKDRIKFGKTALTYVYKAMDTYFEGMTETEKTQQVYKILRDLRQCSIYLERGGVR